MPRIPKQRNMMPINLFKIELVQENNVLLSYVVPKSELGRINYLEASTEDLLDTLLTYAADDNRVEFTRPESYENIHIRIRLINDRDAIDPTTMKTFIDNFTIGKALSELKEEIQNRLSEVKEDYQLTTGQCRQLLDELWRSL